MSARLRINRDALAGNYRLYRASVGSRCGAVVKADGYGLGAKAVAAAFAGLGCNHFFVATAAEGMALKPAVPDSSIYVFEGALPDTAGLLAEARLIPVINHQEQLAAWAPHGDRPIAVHIDTGMNRLGFSVDVSPGALKGFRPILLMTHLACADDPDHPLNEIQLRRFEAVAEGFAGIPTSIGNSAGSLLGPRYQGDLARPGIALYGGNPWLNRPNPVQPVATLEAPVVQIRDVQPGESVGYGATWHSDRPGRLAVLGIGYADGLPRHLSNCGQALVSGKKCPIVGRVSMDLTVVDITDTQAAIGDWAELFGPRLPVDDVAKAAGTIGYELLTGVPPRVTRVYEGG